MLVDWNLVRAYKEGNLPSNLTLVQKNTVRALEILDKYYDSVFSDWRVFEKVALSLTGVIPDPEKVEALTPAEVGLLFKVFRYLHPSAPIVISEDLEAYLKAVFQHNYLYFVPSACIPDLAELEIPLPDTLSPEEIEEAKQIYEQYKDNPMAFFREYSPDEILTSIPLSQVSKALTCTLVVQEG
jgi:hypothetical protein